MMKILMRAIQAVTMNHHNERYLSLNRDNFDSIQSG